MTGPVDEVTKSAADFDKRHVLGYNYSKRSESKEFSSLVTERDWNIFFISLKPPMVTYTTSKL